MTGDDDCRLPRESVVPRSETNAKMRCRECDAEFARREVDSTEKGTLTCPRCGSRDVTDE